LSVRRSNFKGRRKNNFDLKTCANRLQSHKAVYETLHRPFPITRGSNFLPENVTAPRQPAYDALATEEGLLPILPAEKEVEETSRISYQRKVGSILFAAILTRPDIVFAAIY